MMKQHFTIWNKTAPENWDHALAIGNGRLAGMVWGIEEDMISLNHESLWRGVTRMRDNDEVPKEVLGQVRSLIAQEKYFKATAVANAWLSGEGAGVSRRPNRMDLFQPAGDICFRLSGENTYKIRTLDMRTAIAEVLRETESGAEVKLTAFADVCEGVVVCRWESETGFDGTLYYSRPEDEEATVGCTYHPEKILYECSFDGGICYKTAVSVTTDGKADAGEDGIRITGAKTLMAVADISVFLDAVMGDYPRILDYDYEKMSKTHAETFAAQMDAFSLEIKTEGEELPTEELLQRAIDGENIDDLILLYYNFGRYLFLTANFCAELPANLQGKWNHKIKAPWGSDYHLNINLQMNYWMAEPLGMGNYTDSLFRLIEKSVPHAKKAAKDLYGCRGIWLPHAFDMWGRATPESFGYSVWVGAAPWLSQHFWSHYRYTGDVEFLKNRAYPIFKEVAEFYEDYLVRDENGVYQIIPSQSPENSIAGTGLFYVSLGKSSAMDVQLAYDALGYAIDSAEILGVDKGKAKKWKKLRDNLPPFAIGSDGRLLEWDKEYEEKEPGHRHISHLYGLYPSDIFDSETRPEQYHAAKKSLDYRLAQGGGHTGWSSSWVACLYARLGEGELAYNSIARVIKDFSTSSLLDIYPNLVFQIDANYGAVAAVTEMVAQYRGDKLYLLFGAPEHWSEGSIRGLKTPGGHTVDFAWNNGKVTDIAVTIGFGGELKVNMNGEDVVFAGEEGEVLSKGEE
ncbi:MAG: glycoside hydrolase N-terminal domain-containing protein [Clostridia bacterium]|nr:glycoside hydrolase N-terminal domain-containing protein [Clostridia bacterium]